MCYSLIEDLIPKLDKLGKTAENLSLRYLKKCSIKRSVMHYLNHCLQSEPPYCRLGNLGQIVSLWNIRMSNDRTDFCH